MTWESVDLPEPFGPMIAWTSPSFTVSVSPWRISRSSTRTLRSFTSSNAMIFFHLSPGPEERRSARLKGQGQKFTLPIPSRRPLERPPRDQAELADRSFERDRDQLL